MKDFIMKERKKKYMYQFLPIRDVYAREILDSRGNPTLEVEVLAGEDVVGRASVPSGASTGKYEAVELRDGGERFGGKGVLGAVEHVNAKLASEVIGINVFNQVEIDRIFAGNQNLTDCELQYEEKYCDVYYLYGE